MPIINFDNVTYSYPANDFFSGGKPASALSQINLSVNRGEIFAIIGETGSGKTTLCKLINGIIPHLIGGSLTGTVSVCGIDTIKSSVPALAQIAGLVLDDPDAQLFTSSARNEAAFGPENLLIQPEEIEIRVKDALCAVGLSGFEDRRPQTLSGGEKQRLVIASFLTMKSKILVLDEPLCRLDPEGSLKVMSVLKELSLQGVTIVIASSGGNIIKDFADKVCVLNEGSIAACGSAKEIFSDSNLLEKNNVNSSISYNLESFFEKRTCATCETPAIEAINFSFYFDKEKPLIKNLNLKIFDNDFIALTGHNGSGKTTLLKNIAGLLRPCSGDIFIRGINSKDMEVSAISKEAGFVMQNPDNQLFTDSVVKEVSFALKNSGLPKDEIGKRVEFALNMTGIKDKGAFPHALNRQDRAKVVIACVIAMGCKIILFDEIDAGHDYKSSINIMNVAQNLHSKGYTIIFTTHNMPLVCGYARRLIKMEKNGTISEWKRK